MIGPVMFKTSKRGLTEVISPYSSSWMTVDDGGLTTLLAIGTKSILSKKSKKWLCK